MNVFEQGKAKCLHLGTMQIRGKSETETSGLFMLRAKQNSKHPKMRKTLLIDFKTLFKNRQTYGQTYGQTYRHIDMPSVLIT